MLKKTNFTINNEDQIDIKRFDFDEILKDYRMEDIKYKDTSSSKNLPNLHKMTTEELLRFFYSTRDKTLEITYEKFVQLISSNCKICGEPPKIVDYGKAKIARQYLKQLDNIFIPTCYFCYSLLFLNSPQEIVRKSAAIVAHNSNKIK